MMSSALARLRESYRRQKAGKTRKCARRHSLSLETLEVRAMLVGGPIILGGDDLTAHGSFGLGPLDGNGNTVAETEVNDTSVAADPIVIGNDFDGAIGVSEDVDYVSFTGAAGQVVFVSRTLDTLTASTMTFYNTNGTSVLTSTTSEQLNVTLPSAGTYFVKVDGGALVPQAGSGNTVAETELNDSFATADATVIGDDFDATISPTGDADYVSFSLAAGQKVRFTTVRDTLQSSSMTVYDTNGTTQLATGTTTINFTAPAAGTYFVAVRGTGLVVQPGTGNSVAETEANDTSATADPTVIGDDFTGSITPSGDADYTAFTLTAGQQINVARVLGTLSTSRITIYSTDGTTQLSTTTGASINFTAPSTGTFYAAMRGEGVGPLAGNGVTVPESEANDTSATADAAVIGNDFTGGVGVANDEDYVAVTLAAGQQVRFETTLGTLGDSTLTLYGTDGTTQVAFDDNAGPGLGSRIDYTAPAAGTYFIKVRALSTGTGTYTLTLRSLGTPVGTYTLNLRNRGTAVGTYDLQLRNLGTSTGTYTLSVRNGANTVLEGWLYIRKSLENIAPAVTRAGHNGRVALLGSTDATTTTGDAGAAYHHATPLAAVNAPNLTGVVDYYDGAAAINQFFADLAAGTVNPAIIVTAGAGANNDLDAAEGTALTNNAIAIANFVNSGGGLLSHGDIPATSYGWLFALLPGLTAIGPGDSNDLVLTPVGQAAFPGLTNADVNAGPWHNFFQPYSALGGLQVLAIDSNTNDADGNPRAVVIGGAAVSLPGSINLEPDTEQHELGETHTVTAAVTDGNPPAPAVGTVVTFSVFAGPNTGTTGTCTVNVDCTTDANGQVSFTYVGDGGPGTDSIVATFVDGDGNTQTSNGVEAVWVSPPQVVGIFARGTAWQQSFLDELVDAGAGDATWGASLPLPNSQEGATGQPNNLPWINVNQISIVFAEDMTLDINSLTLVGSGSLTQPAQATGFDYDDPSHTATWTFPAALTRNKYLIHLDASAVTDADGHALDGEWAVPDTALPTGNGASGGDFNFRFNVLPADVNGTGTVATAESDGIRRKLNLTPASDLFSHRQDLNGNGIIGNEDFDFARSVLNTTTNFLTNPAVPAPSVTLLSALATTQSLSDSTSGRTSLWFAPAADTTATSVASKADATTAQTARKAIDPVVAAAVFTEIGLEPAGGGQSKTLPKIGATKPTDKSGSLKLAATKLAITFR